MLADGGGAGPAGLGLAVEGDDEGAGGFVAVAAIGARGFAGDVADIAWAEDVGLAFPVELDGTVEDVNHLDAGVAVGVEGGALVASEELGEAGAKAAFGNEDAEAFGDVIGIG